MDEIKIAEYMVDAELIQAVMLKGDLPQVQRHDAPWAVMFVASEVTQPP